MYKILDLLATAETENIELAYQLLQPYLGEETVTELYLMYFVTEEEELRENLRLLLGQYAPVKFANFVTARNHLHGRSEWDRTYMLWANLNPFFEEGILDAQKTLYFFEHLLDFSKMHPTIKGLFIEQGSTKQIEQLIYASKNKNTLILNSCNLTKIPSIVLEMKGLRRLELSNNYIKKLPDNFFECLPTLTTLLLNNNQLIELPQGLNLVTKLQTLNLNNNALKVLPDVIGELVHLRTLNVSNNRLNHLSNNLATCIKLENLYLRGNELKSIPKVILYLNLKSITGIKGFDRAKTSLAFVRFMQVLQESLLSNVEREKIFHLFVNNKAEIEANLGIKDLLDSLKFQNEVVRSRAMGYLLGWSGRTLAENPIKKGDEVFLIGNTNLKKTTIKTRLEKSGITYSTQLRNTTTHVVLGSQPKNYGIIEDQKFTFLTEQDLNQFLNQEDTPYLLEKDADTELNKENIKQLLLSSDEGSIGLGVELLKAGGVPRDLMTELFFVAKTVSDKTIREQAKKMLKVNGSATVQKALANRSQLTSTAYNAEKNISKNLVKLAKLSSEINWTQMGWYLHRNFGNGLRYTFDHEPLGSALRQTVIKNLIQNNKLDFFKAYASYMPTYDSFGYAFYEKTEFPIEILEHSSLIILNCAGCRIEDIPTEINQLKELKSLNLNGNFLTKLPDSFKELKNLKELDLSDNEFTEFPSVLEEMPWLEHIKIGNNRKGGMLNILQLPIAIKNSLSQTEITGVK